MHRRATSTVRAASGRLRATTFSALVQHPNYRLYWLGALTSEWEAASRACRSAHCDIVRFLIKCQ